MYRHILEILGGVFGGKADLVLLVWAVALAGAVLLLLSRAWRRGVREAEAAGGWKAVGLGLVDGLLTLIIGATLVAALGAALLVQSGLFQEHHGQVTQRNYHAVQTNWGPPHEQRELQVAHYVTDEETALVFPDGREMVIDPDAPPTNLPTGEQAPTRIVRKVRRRVAQNSLVEGTVAIDVRMDYRPKGSAYYTCYEDEWTLDYVVRNRADRATEAEFELGLPADQGVFRDLVVQVDGADWGPKLVRSGGAQTWTLPMEPGQTVKVHVHFASRGMEYLRYTPAHMARRDRYAVRMRIFPDTADAGEPARGKQQFVWTEDMAVPIGCMTPTVRTDSPSEGEPMVLAWDLASAATTFGMGVILPDIKQPGYYVTRLLHEAPLGLAVLAAALVGSWMLIGRRTDLFTLGLLATSYTLFYTFVAYLSDHLTSFPACFALAALASLAVAGLYLWLGWGRTFPAHQTLALVVVMTVYYPLAVVLDQYTGFLLQMLYWALAAYAAVLAVARLMRQREGGAAPAA